MWWRVSTIAIIGILLGCIIAGTVFVYNYMFRTIDNSQNLSSLGAEVSITKLNSENYEAAVKLVGLKTTPTIIPNNLRNIFAYSSSTPLVAVPTSSLATSTFKSIVTTSTLPTANSPTSTVTSSAATSSSSYGGQ